MDWDKMVTNLMPGVLAGIMASCYALLNRLNQLFGQPDVPKHIVAKTMVEVFIAFPITMITGVAFAIPLSHVLTSACKVFSPSLEFSPIAAGVLIGFMGVHGVKVVADNIVKRALNRGEA